MDAISAGKSLRFYATGATFGAGGGSILQSLTKRLDIRPRTPAILAMDTPKFLTEGFGAVRDDLPKLPPLPPCAPESWPKGREGQVGSPVLEECLAALDKGRGSRLTKELLDDARKSLDDATTKLHSEAAMIEAAGAEMLAQARLHEAHQKFDLARSLRVAANYLLGVESA